MDPVKLSALLNKVTTTIDGGWRISFDVPQSDVQSVMQLSIMKDQVLILKVLPEGLDDEL